MNPMKKRLRPGISASALRTPWQGIFRGERKGAVFAPWVTGTVFPVAQGGNPAYNPADGEDAALVLDLSEGLALGHNVFDPANAVIASGSLVTYNGDGTWTKSATGNQTVDLMSGPELGKVYLLEFDILEMTNGSFMNVFLDNDGFSAIGNFNMEVGRVRLIAAPSSLRGNGAYIWFNSNDFVGTWGNFSMREIKGNHAMQTEAGLIPTFRKSGNRVWLAGDGSQYLKFPCPFSGDAARTAIVAHRSILSSDSTEYIYDLGARSGPGFGAYWGITNEYSEAWMRYNGSVRFTPAPNNDPIVLTVAHPEAATGEDVTARRNGLDMARSGASQLEATLDTLPPEDGFSRLLANYGGTNGFTGEFAGFLIVDELLNPEERHIAENAFADALEISLFEIIAATTAMSAEPIATDTGYAPMTSVTGTGAVVLSSTGTAQKIAQTEPSLATPSDVRVVEFHYDASEFAGKNTATNFFYVGNPIESEYEQISPASAALQAGSVAGLVINFSTGTIDVYVDGDLDSTVSATDFETNTEQHVGFATNGTCSVTAVFDVTQMAHFSSYGQSLKDWDGNTVS